MCSSAMQPHVSCMAQLSIYHMAWGIPNFQLFAPRVHSASSWAWGSFGSPSVGSPSAGGMCDMAECMNFGIWDKMHPDYAIKLISVTGTRVLHAVERDVPLVGCNPEVAHG